MNSQADVAKPKFHDFKVFLDSTHYQGCNGSAQTSNILPRSGAGSTLYATTGSEWMPSTVVVPTISDPSNVDHTHTPEERALHILGADDSTDNGNIATTGSFAMVQGYAATRVQVQNQQPALPGDASTNWMTLIQDDGEVDQEVINHLESHNDSPPYANAADAPGGDNPIYPGGSESATDGTHFATMRSTTLNEISVAAGGEVMCGLLKVTNTQPGKLRICLAPGTYKGVAAVQVGA